MKKILFCLSLACILPLICACNKGGGEDNDIQTPEMKTPELKEKAVSLSIKGDAPFTDIILTETGKAIMAKALPEQSAPSTHALAFKDRHLADGAEFVKILSKTHEKGFALFLI